MFCHWLVLFIYTYYDAVLKLQDIVKFVWCLTMCNGTVEIVLYVD